ncbi:AGAP005589-PA [Anopheles gambiae str. PEST]|uniref:AGAP005589-PA n=1 Tax=Anopheles gambiae TaxID=7165 RepID=A7UTS1_ANOGA|nr:AGAP005589-PA [Anopheles gambiae str. PEST]
MQKRMSHTITRRWSTTTFLLLMITLTITAEAASLSTEERHSGTEIAESRTFGRIRRLQAMIVPVMFFLGVMKTLLAFLVAISLKTLFVGVSILMINIGLAMAKVIAFFKSKHTYEQHGGYGAGWSDKNIHVHIHNDGGLIQHGSVPLEYEHAPPSALHHTAPNVFPSYGPPTVLNSYHRSRGDTVADPIYVQTATSTVDKNEQLYPKVLISDRDKLDQIYAQWRQLNRNGR